jgi:hypothetical protein
MYYDVRMHDGKKANTSVDVQAGTNHRKKCSYKNCLSLYFNFVLKCRLSSLELAKSSAVGK